MTKKPNKSKQKKVDQKVNKKPTKAETTKKALKILDCRLRGLSYDEIADKLGYKTRGGPYKLLKEHMEKVEAEGVENYRKITLARLEKKIADWWDDPNMQAELLRAINLQNKIMGVYSEKIIHGGTVHNTGASIINITQEEYDKGKKEIEDEL